MAKRAKPRHRFVPLSGSQDAAGVYQRCSVTGCHSTPGEHQSERLAPEREQACRMVADATFGTLWLSPDGARSLMEEIDALRANLDAATARIAELYGNAAAAAADANARELEIRELVGALDGEPTLAAVRDMAAEHEHYSLELSRASYETIPDLQAALDRQNQRVEAAEEALEEAMADLAAANDRSARHPLAQDYLDVALKEIDGLRADLAAANERERRLREAIEEAVYQDKSIYTSHKILRAVLWQLESEGMGQDG